MSAIESGRMRLWSVLNMLGYSYPRISMVRSMMQYEVDAGLNRITVSHEDLYSLDSPIGLAAYLCARLSGGRERFAYSCQRIGEAVFNDKGFAEPARGGLVSSLSSTFSGTFDSTEYAISVAFDTREYAERMVRSSGRREQQLSRYQYLSEMVRAGGGDVPPEPTQKREYKRKIDLK